MYPDQNKKEKHYKAQSFVFKIFRVRERCPRPTTEGQDPVLVLTGQVESDSSFKI